MLLVCWTMPLFKNVLVSYAADKTASELQMPSNYGRVATYNNRIHQSHSHGVTVARPERKVRARRPNRPSSNSLGWHFAGMPGLRRRGVIRHSGEKRVGRWTLGVIQISILIHVPLSAVVSASGQEFILVTSPCHLLYPKVLS